MSTLLLNWEDKINSPELEAYFQQFGAKYYLSAEQINELRDAMNAIYIEAKAIPLVSQFTLVQKVTDSLNINIEPGDYARGFGPGANADLEYWPMAIYLNLTGDNNVNNYLNYKPISVSLPNS
jgi:hypothetical protein